MIQVHASSSVSRCVCRQSGVDPDFPVNLRLVRVRPSTGETEILATSLMDRERFPSEVFADLYHQRWGIETDYSRYKNTLSLENFSGRSVQAVRQDIQARVLLKNLALLMQTLQQPLIEARSKGRKLAWKANFTQGVSRLKNTLVDLVVRPCLVGLANLLALIRDCLVPIRPGRHFPRKRKRLATRGCEGYKPTR